MIKHLRVQDYTIIDELEVDFESGLNIITGETGAGKSIIIDAIDIVLGAKASKEIIKTGKNRAIIELEVSLTENQAQKIINDFELDVTDNTLIISREITSSTSRIRVNGILISLNQLLEIRKLILDIHSQHQTYTYLQPKTHITLLDSFGSAEHISEIIKYKSLYKLYQDKLQKLKKIQESDEKNQQQADFLKFQIDEIKSAQIVDEAEFDLLLEKTNILENAQELKSVSYNAFEALYGENDNIADALDKVKSFLDKVKNCDDNLAEITKNLEGIIYSLKENARDLRTYSENLECDDEALNQAQLRLEVLSKLKRKYGGSLKEVLNNLLKFEEEYEMISNSEEVIKKLEEEILSIKKELLVLSSEISKNRGVLAENLSNMVSQNIQALEMPFAKFKVQIENVPLYINGIDNIEFLITTNPTEEFKPLVKVASGGEVSRVMLAIKTVFANSDDISTVIFDEIDTGISGKTSQAIVKQLSKLAQSHQILCITHQPIIAAGADVHFHVTKVQAENKVEICLKKLDINGRENVIAKMLSGVENNNSLQLAREMLR